MRRPTITKVRPDSWGDGPDLGTHTFPFGTCTVEMNGRDPRTVWTVNGPAPVKMIAKRKYRG